MPFERFLARIAADMILDVGFNERFDDAPFGLCLLSDRFLVRRLTSDRFLPFLYMLGLSLGIELGALGFRTRFGDTRSFLGCSPARSF